ncbi:hypothetical protein GAG94_03460 [Lysinibacillus sphaericus]|nr:hypothetical protein GAG94_03460 [Lysinibacillus sphaericus]
MKPFLLLYIDSKGNEHFGWFEDENEMRSFVETEDVMEINEALEIFNAREIEMKIS